METQIATDFHKNLANYFAKKPLYLDDPTQKNPNIRKLVEQPWQQTKRNLWNEVTETLCNLDFIQAKAAAKMTFDLVVDFNNLLQLIPENDENIRLEKERQEKIDKYSTNLTRYSMGMIKTLQIPESILLKLIKSRLTNNSVSPTAQYERLMDFNDFLGQEANNLQEYSKGNQVFTIQQAWNYANDGPVAKTAEKKNVTTLKNIILFNPATRPIRNPHKQLIRTMYGHSGQVLAISMTPDGKFAFTGSMDKNCILWECKTGRILRILHGHKDIVSSVSITPSGSIAISGSHDQTCILWNLLTGEIIHILKGHKTSVLSVSITPDGKTAVSGASDRTILTWNLKSGESERMLQHPIVDDPHASFEKSYSPAIDNLKHTIEKYNSYLGIHAIAITPDGKFAISGSGDMTCILWDLVKGVSLQIYKGHTGYISSISITPDKKYAITGSYDRTCIFWDITTSKIIHILKGHNSAVLSVAITPDAKMAISGSADKTCILWDLTKGNRIQILRGHNYPVGSTSISPDGERAISGSDDKTCKIWNLASGYINQIVDKHVYDNVALAIIPNTKYAITGNENDCLLWNLSTGKEMQIHKIHADLVLSIAISPDCKRVISGGLDRKCIFWNLSTGKTERIIDVQDSRLIPHYPTDYWENHHDVITAIAFTPDGKRAISGSADNNCIIWDMSTGERLHVLKGHSAGILTIAISPDGKIAVSGSNDKSCIVWDIISGKSIKTLKGHNDSVSSIRITPDGRKVISASWDKTCMIWDLASSELLLTLTGYYSTVSSIAISPDSKRVLTSSYDNRCILWDIDTGEQLAQVVTLSTISSMEYFMGSIAIAGSLADLKILTADRELFSPGKAIITIKQIWNFEKSQYQDFAADCPMCGHRFTPPSSVMQMIRKISKKAGLNKNDSPCIKLPSEAWQNPELQNHCPQCGDLLKFNPFVVDKNVKIICPKCPKCNSSHITIKKTTLKIFSVINISSFLLLLLNIWWLVLIISLIIVSIIFTVYKLENIHCDNCSRELLVFKGKAYPI